MLPSLEKVLVWIALVAPTTLETDG